MFNIKKPGHKYFQKNKTHLFDSIKSTVSLAATNFPTFPEGKSVDDLAGELPEDENAIENAFSGVADNKAIALTVTSQIGRSEKNGGTIILNEQDQDNLILGILERRGKKGIGKIIERIGLELAEEPIDADGDAKSKFCPSANEKLPGEESEEEGKTEDKDDCDCPVCQLRRSLTGKGRGTLEVKVTRIGGRDGGPSGNLDDLFETLGRVLRR